MRSRDRTYAAASAMFVLIGVAAAFYMLGTPRSQREIEADLKRVRDLQAIAVMLRSRAAGGLPATLEETGYRGFDPVTRRPYEYRRLGETRFELCAIFSTDTTGQESPDYQFTHGVGRRCFSLDVHRSW